MEIAVNGITLHYEKKGNGAPLILLHGNGEDHHIFDKLIEKLAPYYTVYAIDSRNHGLSTKTDNFGYSFMADDIIAFIHNLKIREPSVLGFSDGAIISLLVALQHKDIFNKLILSGVNLNPSDFKDENLAWLNEEYTQTGDPLLKLMLEEPNIKLDSLKQITNKTLVVGGENDLFNDHLFSDITATMPDASLLIMKGYDHAGYIVDQDILYPYIKEFLT